MDDIVKQAMAKWPNVPAVFGWLGLDRRGNWLIKNERISNPVVTEFIGRNYDHDASGRWFFQNGPQRVFVTCDYTPLVYRLADSNVVRLQAHTGKGVSRVTRAWIDESGVVLIETELGPGIVDDRDLERLLASFTDSRGEALAEDAVGEAIERLQSGHATPLHFKYAAQTVRVCPLRAAHAASELGFVRNPEAA